MYLAGYHCKDNQKKWQLSIWESVGIFSTDMKIFIDNGHGQFTAGKRSPDGQFREYGC